MSMHLLGNIRTRFIVFSVAWTLLLAAVLFSNLKEHRQSVHAFAKSEADVLIQHMKAARLWNATHGGVYMEVSEKAGANPYLLGRVAERDIETPGGRKLTLVNPAYMTRLINEYFNQADKRIAHITSLNPLRPENRADAWESKALKSFESGVDEVSEITSVNGKPFMRLMRPLVTRQACLQCHADQGYKLGDIRGGITASVPFEKHAAYLQELNIKDSLTYGVIWLLGLIGILSAYRRLSRGEQKLKQTEANLHILSSSVEQANEAIIITDKQGIIEYVNPAFVKLTGYNKQDVLGKNPSILQSGIHDKIFYSKLWTDLAAGIAWQGRIVDQKKDGSCYPAMLTISPIKNAKGEITHYVGSQQDLREYEHLEEQFHQAQKMEALGTLVGGIAHDFNNSLAAISGNAYLAKLAVEGNPEATRMLDTIETLSFRSAAMIKQLLAYSRKDMKSMNPMNLSSFLKEAIKIHKVSLPENIKLELNIEDVSLMVQGDIGQSQQVIMNLINNAKDAVQDSAEPAITVSLTRFETDAAFRQQHPELKEDSFACIGIKDNGHGINGENLGLVFDPFFTTKEVGKGTGLGLSMAYGAIKSHGGIITIESDLPCGTQFNVLLPLLAAEQTEMPADHSNERLLRGTETILVVDDEPSVVETTRAVLQSLGYTVLIAGNGQEAVALYQSQQHNIDLLIMDVVMPELSGIEAAKAIRQLNPQVKIIFATGYDRSNSLDGKAAMHSETVISKPFSAGSISRLIRSVLEAGT